MSAFQPLLNEVYHKERLQDIRRRQPVQVHGPVPGRGAQSDEQGRASLPFRKLVGHFVARAAAASPRRLVHHNQPHEQV